MTNARFSGWAPWLLASLLAIASAGALAAANTLDVPIATNVKGSTEPVAFAGSARILTRKLLDNVLGSPPVLEIVVDLRPVAAVGVASGNAYVFSGPVILHRR